MAEQMLLRVKDEAARRLRRLQSLPEHPQKAALANLRRGVGRAPGELPELWGIFLQELPPDMESRDGAPTRAEWAIYLALTLYALHQQGHSLPQDNMHRQGIGFGQAVRGLVKEGESPEESSILRRFNALATADTMPERAQHLRGIIQMLRANGLPLDYVALSGDLYALQIPALAPGVCLRWGQDYYRTASEKEKTSATTENEKEN